MQPGVPASKQAIEKKAEFWALYRTVSAARNRGGVALDARRTRLPAYARRAGASLIGAKACGADYGRACCPLSQPFSNSFPSLDCRIERRKGFLTYICETKLIYVHRCS